MPLQYNNFRMLWLLMRRTRWVEAIIDVLRIKTVTDSKALFSWSLNLNMLACNKIPS